MMSAESRGMQAIIDLTAAGKNVRRIVPLLTQPRTSWELCQHTGLNIGQIRSSLRTLRYAGLLHISIRYPQKKQIRVYVLNAHKGKLADYEVQSLKQPRMVRKGTQQVLGVWI